MDGYKTYLIAAGAVIYALYGHFVAHTLDANTAFKIVQDAVLASTIRHGIKTGA